VDLAKYTAYRNELVKPVSIDLTILNNVQESDFPFVSIVVCTYNRKDFLKDCLASIRDVDFPKSRFETVVVDGGSNDGTIALCKQFPEMRFIVEEKYGLAYARNKGAELAKGTIVVYTDDDCIVDKYWLRGLVLGFQQTQSVAAVGGPVCALHPESIPAKIHVKAALGLFDEGVSMKLTKGIITSNAAFKKEVFQSIQFDESLGVTRRRKLILCGEDVDFCNSILALNLNILYTPYAKVYHQVPLRRLRVSYIIKHAIHNGVSRVRWYLKKGSRIRAIRFSIGQLVQDSLKVPFDRSFTSCYNLIYCLSTFLVSVTCLDKLFQ
jgi:glycosyltransferase involved in cell wall biosynthesis